MEPTIKKQPFKERTITIEPARLDTDGTYLLRDIARNSHWRSIYGLVNPSERVTLTVWDSDALGCDDTVRIRVRSTIAWADRARRFGVAGLSPEHCSGRTASDGTPIPTEERIAAVQQVYGDQPVESREWRWPEWPREADDETAWFNAAARSLYEYCRNGCFEVC